MNQRPIGIFDSGIGGLTVVEALHNIAPNENIVYLKDEAHFPYGNKTPEEVIEVSLNAANVLFKHNIKALIIACHTASVFATEALKAHLPIIVVGLTSSSVQTILSMKEVQRLAIIGTPAAMQSNVYPTLLQKAIPSLKTLSISMPYLAPLIERNGVLTCLDAFSECLQKDLTTIKHFNPDALFLACTHYPLISSLFNKLLGPTIPLIDSSIPAAKEAINALKVNNLINRSSKNGSIINISTKSPS